MAKLEYLKKNFARPRFTPLKPNEYEIIKNNYENFIESFLKQQKEENSMIYKEHYPFRFMIKLFSFFGIISIIIKYLKKNEVFSNKVIDVLAFFHLPTLLFGIGLVVQFFSFINTRDEFIDYKRRVMSYYKFHKKIIDKTNSYDDYTESLNKKKK